MIRYEKNERELKTRTNFFFCQAHTVCCLLLRPCLEFSLVFLADSYAWDQFGDDLVAPTGALHVPLGLYVFLKQAVSCAYL